MFPRNSKDDTKFGIRFDVGKKKKIMAPDNTTILGYERMVNLQLNRNAENPTIKETVKAIGSHGVRLGWMVPLNEVGTAIHPDTDPNVFFEDMDGGI